MNKTVKLSSSQINKMKHAIGLDNARPVKKHYTPYRNTYFTGDDVEWNELVGMKLANKSADPFCKGDFVYSVTSAGIAELEVILGIKIKFE